MVGDPGTPINDRGTANLQKLASLLLPGQIRSKMTSITDSQTANSAVQSTCDRPVRV